MEPCRFFRLDRNPGQWWAPALPFQEVTLLPLLLRRKWSVRESERKTLAGSPCRRSGAALEALARLKSLLKLEMSLRF